MFPNKYKSSEARVLYLVARKGYGTFSALADDLGVQRQFISECLKFSIPINYAGYLGRKFNFCPGLLCFERYAQIMCTPWEYRDMLDDTSYFSQEECRYILDGFHIKDVARLLKSADKEIGK